MLSRVQRSLSGDGLRRVARFWGPFLGAGIRVKHIRDDFREILVSMKLSWYNKNYVGSHYGGSLYSMADPFYMLMLLRNLGQDYKVWDVSGSIEYVKPGRGEVFAKFELDEECIKDVVERASGGEAHYEEFAADIVDTSGEVVARVKKVVYVRKKKGR